MASTVPLLGPPDESEATVFSVGQLIKISIIQISLIILYAIPSIIMVVVIGYGYSRLDWTRNPFSEDGYKAKNYYFNCATMFWFDDIMRTLLICVQNVIIGCVLYERTLRETLIYLCTIALPYTIFGNLSFGLMWTSSSKFFIWYNYMDIVVFMLVYFMVVGVTQIRLSRRANVLQVKAFKRYVIPVYVMAIGTMFVDIYLSKVYKIEPDGSWQKYVQRLILYPIIVDLFLGFGEFFIRGLDGTSIHSRAHSIYFIQVRFGIIGRYMNISASSLSELAIVCGTLAVKDVLFHRMSRLQCGLFYFCRKYIRKFFSQGHTNETQFRQWYFDENFRQFRACVINNELLQEFTAAIVTPLLLLFFREHRLLFKFSDDLFVKDGKIDMFMYQFAIQLTFLFITYFLIMIIESRYNGIDLRFAFSKKNMLQEISQVVIFLWGMIQILSAVKVLPNYFQCDDDNICHCWFHVNLTQYGCNHSQYVKMSFRE